MSRPFAVRRRDERGSTALELAILAPGLLLFIVLLVYAGRVEIAGQAVQQAAEQAARNASLARTQGDASSMAHSEARNTLNQQDLQCTTLDVAVNTVGFDAPVGTPATVTATVQCNVRLSDLALPGLPGTKTVTGKATSALDTYRGRG